MLDVVRRFLLRRLLPVLLLPLNSAVNADMPAGLSAPVTVNIGVLAYRGKQHARERWSPTADYLSASIPGYRFTIVPVNLDEIAQAIKRNRIQFTLTNPGNYVDLETRFGISRIATLQSRDGGQSRVRFGAVVVVRADNTAIRTLKDLKGKSFMAVSPRAFGGFQMAWRELERNGIDPFEDFSVLKFAGFPQDKIIHAVDAGAVDAATVRAETLARMLEDGAVAPGALRVLNLQHYPDTPFPVSTRLYPEWPFATLKGTARVLATRVAQALLSMPADHPAAQVSRTAGWTIPLDYSPVHDLLKALKIGPYEALRDASLAAMIKRYVYWFAGAGTLLLALLLLNGYVSRTNHRLKETERSLRNEIQTRKQSQEILARYRDTLEEQVSERTEDLRATNQALEKSRLALRELVRISSAPELSHDERLARLLDTGRAYYGLHVAVLASRGDTDKPVCRISGDRQLTVSRDGPLIDCCAAQLLKQPGEPLDIPDLERALAAQPGCFLQGLKCYLGIAVLVEGRPDFTLEFAGRATRNRRLSQWDRDLLKVMAQWIGDELERQSACAARQQHHSELARVSRLSTIGEMAASLAHELNQPLTGAINYSSGCLRLLRKGEADTGKLMDAMERAVEGATLAADIIRHVREFVQKSEVQHSAVDLNSAVRDVIALIDQEASRHHVEIQLELAEDLPAVEGNLIQLEQVILNFLRNGIDAIDAAGHARRQLTIATSRYEGRVKLTASDTGEGIPDAALARIFDAFYTTKSDGMGIGLSISRSIIESHQGRVSARSLPGGGAELSFDLPVLQGG